jgi:hypothetical protein
MKSNTITLQLYVIFNVFLQYYRFFLPKPIEPEIDPDSCFKPIRFPARNLAGFDQ